MNTLNELREQHPNINSALESVQRRYQSAIRLAGDTRGIASDTIHRLVTPRNLLLAGPLVATGSVWGLGVIEGAILSGGDPAFSAAYGLANIGRSITWAREAPETVALAFNIARDVIQNIPAEALKDNITSPEAAQIRIIMDALLDARGSIADGTIMAYLITAATRIPRWGEQLRTAIFEGIETLRKNPEQVFFLGGEQSGVLQAAMLSDLTHIFPIVEKPEAVSELAELASKGGQYAFYLRLDGNHYENPGQWNKLTFRRNWLAKTDDGRRKYLLVVGDGSVYEEAIDLHDQPRQDLDVKELQIATQALVRRASECGIKEDEYQTVTIYIGNARLERKSGSGEFTQTDRQLARRYKNVDIWIDTRAPLVEKILEWVGNDKAIVFDTLNQEYFKNLKKLMGEKGVNVYDANDPKRPKDAKRLVYEDTTAYTVTKAKRIVETKQATRGNVATLTDTIEGHQDTIAAGLTSVCSAKIYKDEVFAVRKKLKQGKTSAEIQKEFDKRWNHPGLTEEDLAAETT